MNKITVDKSKMEMLSRELSKLQCWLTGYHAGAGHKPNQLGINIPGEDAVRQTKLLLRDMIQEAEAAVAEPEPVVEEAVEDSEGWIVHDGKDMPVSGNIEVEYFCRDNYSGVDRASDIGEWWNHEECFSDDAIVRYRIVK